MKSFFSIYPKLFTLITVVLMCSYTYGQDANDALRLGFPGISSDPRALGMGDSYIGLSDGAGAAFFNPAGWALMKKMELSAGLSYDNFSNNTSFLGNSTSSSNSATRLDNISFALPFPTARGSLVVGFAYHTTKDLTTSLSFNGFNNGNTSLIQDFNSNTNIPYDLYLTDTNYATPINGKLNQMGSILATGETHDWTFSGAFEAYRNFFVGLNINIISGSYNNNNQYYEEDTQGNYANIETDPGNPATKGFNTFYLNRILNWDISGWDAKFGMLYQLNNARIGLTVQFPKTYTVKEVFDVNGYSQFNTGQEYDLDPNNYSDNVQYDIITPYEIGLGLSVNLSSLILSAQATFIDYTQLKFDNASGLSDSYVAQKNSFMQDSLRAVLNYNVGAEYTFPDVGLRLRAGYLFQPSAYKNDPSSYGRSFITGGVGYLIEESVGIDVAYAHGWWNDFGDNYGTNVSRTTQKITLDQIILGMTYRF